MAEPISILGGVGSAITLAGTGCHTASQLYSFFRSVVEAPQCIQRLSKELRQTHSVLLIVESYMNQQKLTASVIREEVAIAQVEGLLRECNEELKTVQRVADSFGNHTKKVKEFARRIKWTVEERRIEQHCVILDRFNQRLMAAVLIVGKWVSHTTKL